VGIIVEAFWFIYVLVKLGIFTWSPWLVQSMQVMRVFVAHLCALHGRLTRAWIRARHLM
jgi:hypothetical protein